MLTMTNDDFSSHLSRRKIFKVKSSQYLGFPGGTSGKEPACQCRRHNKTRVRSLGREDPLEKEMATHSSVLAWELPWVGKIPWRGEWLPTPVFLPGEFHGQRNLAGYSPWGLKECDPTEQITLHFLSSPS